MTDCAPGRTRHHFVAVGESLMFEGVERVECLHCPAHKLRRKEGADLKLVLGVVGDDGKVEIK